MTIATSHSGRRLKRPVTFRTIMAGQSDFQARKYGLTLAASCVLGAAIGWLLMPEPRAIDGALVLAGQVDYPPGSIQGIYFHNMWTATHQLLGLALWYGVDQTLAASLFNAVLMATIFAGLALVTLAFTGSLMLSVVTPLLVTLCSFFLVWSDYPVSFFIGHSYGQLALSLSVLCFGVLGNRRYFAGGILAGLLPSFHLVMGVWTIGIALLGLFLVSRPYSKDSTRMLKGLVFGLLISLVSFAWFWFHRVPLDGAVDADAFGTYMEYWEHHRSLKYQPWIIVFTAGLLILLWALYDFGRHRRSTSVVQMASLLMVSAVLSQIAYEVVHWLPGLLPEIAVNAMPGRFISVNNVVAFPVLIGALVLLRLTAILLIAAIPLMALVRKWFLIGFLLLSFLAGLIYAMQAGYVARIGKYSRWFGMAARPVRNIIGSFAVVGLVTATVALFSLGTKPTPTCSAEIIDDCQAPKVFKRIEAISMQGLVVAPAGLALMVHRHGHKPVLAGASSFDFVPYLPQAAAEVRDILEMVYGVNFHHPPAEYRGKPFLIPGEGRSYWEVLGRDDWQRLAARFCIGAVVAPANWKIDLPLTFEAENVGVYLLPAALPSDCTGSHLI